MKKAMVLSVLAAVLLTLDVPRAALASATADISGTVLDAGGQPVAGAEISAQDGAGKVVARSVTDATGSYRLTGLEPGQYTLTLNPLSTGFEGNTFVASLGAEGLTVQWTVSSTAPAIAAATPGVVAGSAALASGASGIGVGTAVAVGGAVAAGGTVGGLAASGAFDGGSGQSSTPSQ